MIVDGWMGGCVNRKMNRILGYKDEIWDPAKAPIVASWSIACLKGPSLNVWCVGRSHPWCPTQSGHPGLLGLPCTSRSPRVWTDRGGAKLGRGMTKGEKGSSVSPFPPIKPSGPSQLCGPWKSLTWGLALPFRWAPDGPITPVLILASFFWLNHSRGL